MRLAWRERKHRAEHVGDDGTDAQSLFGALHSLEKHTHRVLRHGSKPSIATPILETQPQTHHCMQSRDYRTLIASKRSDLELSLPLTYNFFPHMTAVSWAPTNVYEHTSGDDIDKDVCHKRGRLTHNLPSHAHQDVLCVNLWSAP
jgi:hypothetical protein